MRRIVLAMILVMSLALSSDAADDEELPEGKWFYTLICRDMNAADRYEALYSGGEEPQAIDAQMRTNGGVPGCASASVVVIAQTGPFYLFRMRDQPIYVFEATIRLQQNNPHPETRRLSIGGRMELGDPRQALVFWPDFKFPH